MSTAIKALIQVICFGLPWRIRRPILVKTLGYAIDPTARIGLSVVLADEAILEAGAVIGHCNYVGRLDRLVLREESMIGRYNWITGLSKRMNSPFFKGKTSRKSELILGRGSLIATWHLVDCTDMVEFGDFVGMAGARSQIITHGVDIMRMRQVCSPVTIGAHSMLATGVIVMKGVTIAPCCIVGAGSVVMKSIKEPHSMVAGNPAEFVRALPPSAAFFRRTQAVVY